MDLAAAAFNMENNLSIVELLHDISQLDYQVQFCGDFEGMIRAELRYEYDESYYVHEHLGFPGCDRARLEKDIVESLEGFLKKAKEENEKV